MLATSEKFSRIPPTIQPLDSHRVSLMEKKGLVVKPLEPIGFEVRGADVRSTLPKQVRAYGCTCE